MTVNCEFVCTFSAVIFMVNTELLCVLHCSPHPYLFFNEDGDSFTFMGFIINRQTGDILDPRTHAILTPQALPLQLQAALIGNRVNLSENFDQLPRHVYCGSCCFMCCPVDDNNIVAISK